MVSPAPPNHHMVDHFCYLFPLKSTIFISHDLHSHTIFHLHSSIKGLLGIAIIGTPNFICLRLKISNHSGIKIHQCSNGQESLLADPILEQFSLCLSLSLSRNPFGRISSSLLSSNKSELRTPKEAQQCMKVRTTDFMLTLMVSLAIS